MHAGAGIADIGAVAHRRAAGLAGDAHRPGGCLRYRLGTFEPAVRAIGAETPDPSADRPRIERPHALPREPPPVPNAHAAAVRDAIRGLASDAGARLCSR